MKCNRCGYESVAPGEFCVNCGAPLTAPVECRNPVSDKILIGLKDKLFLILCIAQSVSCVLGALVGSFDVISILLTIFMWLVYSKAQKGIVDVNNMRNVSGVVYATYVLTYVLAGLIVFLGVIGSWVLTSFSDMFAEALNSKGLLDQQTIDMILDIPGVVVIVICLVVAIITCIINFFGYRKIHCLVKSTYKAVESGDITMIGDVSGAKLWLWIFGILSAIGAAGSLMPTSFDIMNLLVSGSAAACYIISALLVDKYLIAENSVPLNNVPENN